MSLLDAVFKGEYELELTAWGEGVLREQDLLDMQKPDKYLGRFEKKYHRFPRDISLFIDDPMASGLSYGYTGIDTAFLEKLSTLRELILPDSITGIDVTPGLERILKDNNTLIRGTFDSFAERFAEENGLRFRHSDFTFAEYYFEPAQESTSLIMRFLRDGNVRVEEKISSPGASSSHTFGGSFYHDLSRDFFMDKTAEQVAGEYGSRLQSAILESGKLAAFIEKARTHRPFTGAE